MTKTLMFDVAGVETYDPEKVKAAFEREVLAGNVPVKIQTRYMGYHSFENGTVQLNFTAVTGNGLNSRELTRMDRELREQIEEGVKWFRQHIPGFENCTLLRTPAAIGVRAGRSGAGIETITQQDIDEDALVKEPVAVGLRRYGDHGIKAFSSDWAKPVSGCRSIPRGALIQKDFDNLLLAGRAISCEPKVITCIRYYAQCIATGQAAGTLAALAVKAQKTGADIAYSSLREALLRQGAILEICSPAQ